MAHRRTEAHLLERLWGQERTRVLRVGDGRAPTAPGSGGRQRSHLAWVPPSGVSPRLPVGVVAYLGTDVQGVDRLVVAAAPDPDWSGLRELGPVLGDVDISLLTLAVALTNWHAGHLHCPRCGSATEPAQAGWTRRCVQDGTEHYPRTDPAVIMAVTDDDDRLLLGRGARWPANRFSTLAGFVEPGETLEDAVRREVLEESGVVVEDVTYLGGQPWPFPASLMLGCSARAVRTEVTVDGDEIVEARWFTRADIDQGLREGTLLLPPAISIARALVHRWYGAPLSAP